MLGSPKRLLGLVLLVTGLLLAWFGLLLLGPLEFQATARIQLEPEIDYNALLTNGIVPFGTPFIPATFEIIQSDLVLSNVGAALNLETVWGNKFADGKKLSPGKTMARLRNRLTMAPARNTKVIAISVRSEDPVEAAKLANAICDAYVHYREETKKQLTAKGLKFLQQQYADENQEIQTLQTNIQAMRQQFGTTNETKPSIWTNPPYHEADRRLEMLTAQHKLLFDRLNDLRSNDLIIQDAPVLPIDYATPPTSPNGPNRLLGAAVLALGLITAVVGGFLIMQNRAAIG